MPSTSLSWFRKGIDPGTIITLDQPPSSQWPTTQWTILEKVHEDDFQVSIEENSRYGTPSYATVKLQCSNPTNQTKKAFMRIYLQIPHHRTEIDDPDTRSHQAMDLTPSELTGYQDLTQKGSRNTPHLLGWKKATQDWSGLVPGGFVIWLVYDIVPGLRLGNKYGDGPFWALERSERDLIRTAFLESLRELLKNGWYPDVPAARSLVWHRETRTIFFVGRFARSGKSVDPPAAVCLAIFKLAIPHPDDDWSERDWNGDTERWTW